MEEGPWYRRIRKIHAFLTLWIAAFVAGFLLTSMNVIYLVFVSLFDGIYIFHSIVHPLVALSQKNGRKDICGFSHHNFRSLCIPEPATIYEDSINE